MMHVRNAHSHKRGNLFAARCALQHDVRMTNDWVSPPSRVRGPFLLKWHA